ncbi:MAG: SGNH/GDSL hydrolase family protein [Muribaculaceae bacterium]|nr:SGNH/GDSL hydrolase family protein [Muribaculaceae bacterium]
MKKLFLFLVLTALTLSAVAAGKPEFKYVDASTLTTINKGHNNGMQFKRVDISKYPGLSLRHRHYFGFPTGIALRFRTNSPSIKANWVTTDSCNKNNMPANSTKGLDLYIKDKDGKWLWAGFGRAKYNGTKHSSTLVSGMDTTMKECMLYLPLFMELEALKIGVEKGSKIESEGGFKRAPIVAMGSSYTHGSGTSRAGMAWPAQLSRMLGVDIANFGTSGICKMEPFLADIIADTDADMFIFDTFSNPTAEEIHERFVPFVKRIREAHPNTPLVFLQTFVRESGNFDLKKRKFEEDKRQAAAEELAKIMKTDKNIYFLNPGLYSGTNHDAMCDGVHPSDAGYIVAAQFLEPQIREIMKKYNIH